MPHLTGAVDRATLLCVGGFDYLVGLEQYMSTGHSKPSQCGLSVNISLEDENPISQSSAFRCCPLGLQFNAPHELDEYAILNFSFNAPELDNEIRCAGTVVNCVPLPGDSGEFRISIYFLDVDADTQKILKKVCENDNLLCPHCENFRKMPQG